MVAQDANYYKIGRGISLDYGSSIIDSCDGGDIRICNRGSDFQRRRQDDGGPTNISINVVGDGYVYNYKLGKCYSNSLRLLREDGSV